MAKTRRMAMTDPSTPPVHLPPPKKQTNKKGEAVCSHFLSVYPLNLKDPLLLPPYIRPTPKKEDAACSHFRLPPASDGSKTAPFPSPIQKRADYWCCAANFRAICSITDHALLRLCRRIRKSIRWLLESLTDMVTNTITSMINPYLRRLSTR
jgi:hypothetical protein